MIGCRLFVVVIIAAVIAGGTGSAVAQEKEQSGGAVGDASDLFRDEHDAPVDPGDPGDADDESPPADTRGTDSIDSADGERPWADGVPADMQSRATALFDEGNELLRDSFFREAVDKYREALEQWDHPAIHYNIALALINLDQPLEVYASLQRALSYDGKALDSQKRELATRYSKLVEQQIVRVTVTCEEPGAKAIINGKEAFACPGSEMRLLRAGEHTFTASKTGFETAAKTLLLPGGEATTVELKLYRLADLTRYRRRFDTWIPWTVAGSGLALGAVGAMMHLSARGNFDDFDRSIAACVMETGLACEPSAGLRDQRSRGELKQAVAIGMYAAGAAAIVSGVTMLVLNRPRPYRIDAENPGTPDPALVVTPTVGDKNVGVSALVRF
jgi:hypothetical protein